MKNYVQQIRELREDHHETQLGIVAYLGTMRQVCSQYGNGKNEIPLRHLITLCKLYNFSADYILGLSDEPKH